MRLRKFILAAIITLLLPANALAIPAFARRIGRDCSYCHHAFPKLNETGRIYRSGGYRFADEEEWPGFPKNLESIPVALEVEIEGVYNKTIRDGRWRKDTDWKVEEVEILAGGSFGRTGRVSFFAAAGMEELEGDDGSRDFHGFLGPLFLQVNDLIGPPGQGRLNFRAGQWEVALPFLSSTGRLVKNGYFAEKELNLFTPEQRAVELNGSIVAEEESPLPTHRFALGLSREDIHDARKMRGLYGSYSLTFSEAYSIGAIFRHGKERSGPALDIRTNRYGLAAEGEVGPAIITLAYFVSDRDGREDRFDYLAELLVLPVKKVTLGIRGEILKEKARRRATSLSAMARYDITSKIYAQVELRSLSDYGHVTGSSDRERKGRFYLVALF